jgi:hypothetical protein
MRIRLCQRLLAFLAVAGLIFPSGALAGPPGVRRQNGPAAAARETTTPRTIDVALSNSGTLQGAVVNPDGVPQVGLVVSLVRSGKVVASTKSGEHGLFRFEQMKSGLYECHTKSGACLCRIWTRQGAPPVAAPSMLIVDGFTVERGQQPIREMLCSDPILMGTIVAAAVAIPIAVHKSRDDAIPSS